MSESAAEAAADGQTTGSFNYLDGAVGSSLYRTGALYTIRDADGLQVPDRVIGTVWARTDSVMEGYLNNAEATAAALSNGWIIPTLAGRQWHLFGSSSGAKTAVGTSTIWLGSSVTIVVSRRTWSFSGPDAASDTSRRSSWPL